MPAPARPSLRIADRPQKYVLGGEPLKPACTACGGYLLPCTVTDNGFHPAIAVAQLPVGAK